jgi:hypothetical protein
MMNDGNPIKPKIKGAIRQIQKKRYANLLLHEADLFIQKNPNLLKEKLTAEETQAIQEKWSGLRMPVATKWHHMYKNVLGHADPRMIPLTIFHLRFEPYLTDARLMRAYADKNTHHIHIPDAKIPDMILQHIHRRYYGAGTKPLAKSQVATYLKEQEGDFFLKPSIAGNAGKHIRPFSIRKGKATLKGKEISFEDLLAPYPQNFLIQRKVVQHPLAAALHPESVNTFRITTLREGHDIRVQSNLLRVGQGGSQIDNTSKGGLVLGVYQGGRLSDRALDGGLAWVDKHPDTGIVFSEAPALTFSKQVEEEAIRLHHYLPYADAICWDLTYDEHGQVVVIEYNLGGFGVIYQQAFCGPYFGDKTEEWIEHMREVWKDADHKRGYYQSLPRL